MDTPFSFWLPLLKSEAFDAAGRARRYVEGVASTEDLDLQGERVIQKGIDFTPLLERGYIDWNHMAHRDPAAIIGVPEEARLESYHGAPALYLKALLYDDEGGLADRTWGLINTVAKANDAGYPVRRIGWSVEGAVTNRRGGELLASQVRMAALTHEPVNPSSFAGLAKALVASSRGDDALLKSFTTMLPHTAAMGPSGAPAELGAIALQNLTPGAGPLTAKQIRMALLGGCVAPHHHILEGCFTAGRGAMLEHLVRCLHSDPSDAKTLVRDLYRSVA